jgi:hypothetical protein
VGTRVANWQGASWGCITPLCSLCNERHSCAFWYYTFFPLCGLTLNSITQKANGNMVVTI